MKTGDKKKPIAGGERSGEPNGGTYDDPATPRQKKRKKMMHVGGQAEAFPLLVASVWSIELLTHTHMHTCTHTHSTIAWKLRLDY